MSDTPKYQVEQFGPECGDGQGPMDYRVVGPNGYSCNIDAHGARYIRSHVANRAATLAADLNAAYAAGLEVREQKTAPDLSRSMIRKESYMDGYAAGQADKEREVDEACRVLIQETDDGRFTASSDGVNGYDITTFKRVNGQEGDLLLARYDTPSQALLAAAKQLGEGEDG